MTRLVAALGIVTVAYLAAALHSTDRRLDRLEHPGITPASSPSPEASASPLPRATPTRASRSRLTADHRTPQAASTPPHGTATGSLDITGYCWTGARTASGPWPRIGMAAGNRWPFGTRLRVPGIGVVTITDRIGHGSDLDIYLGHDGCDQRARHFGRHHLPVEVLP